MSVESLSKGQARKILRSLRTGSVPSEYARDMFVGHDRWFTHAVEEMMDVAEDNHFSARFVRAKYGGGKTHFLKCLEEVARENGWVTSFVTLRPNEVELDRFSTVAVDIANKLLLPNGERGLSSLLEISLSKIAESCGYKRGSASSIRKSFEATQEKINTLCNQFNLSFDFRLALRTIMLAHIDRDEFLFHQIARWMAGGEEKLVLDPKRLELHSGTHATPIPIKALGLGSADEHLRLLALLVQWAGNRGFLLTIDEVELVASMPVRRRKNAFQTLRALIDQTDPNRHPVSTCMFLAATPAMFEDPDMFPSYKALQDRIESLPSVIDNGKINFLAPVIDLDSTELNREELLLIAENILSIHNRAGGSSTSGLRKQLRRLVEAVVSTSYVIARPRLLCRMVIDLLEGKLGSDLKGEMAQLSEKIESHREKEVRGE